MSTEYRNAVRSRQLIKQALVTLAQKKDLRHITVVDIVRTADISRNTFYAHYRDVLAVWEDLENTFRDQLNAYLDEAIEHGEFGNPLPLLKKVQHIIEQDLPTNRVLLTQPGASDFCQKLKDIFLHRVMENRHYLHIKDETGFAVFVSCLASGFIDLYRANLSGDNTYTLSQITEILNAMYLHGVPLYQ